MDHRIFKVYQGRLIDEEDDMTLFQLSRLCGIETREIIEMVEEGILEPAGRSKNEWRFSFTSVERLKKARRLRRDFDLTLPGAALALHLLDRIEELERMLERLER